jgi:phosphopantetheine adenylyltransferase
MLKASITDTEWCRYEVSCDEKKIWPTDTICNGSLGLFTKEQMAHITTDVFEQQYLINYCAKVNAGWYVRGIRNEEDFKFERAIINVNHEIKDSLSDDDFWSPKTARPVWLPATVSCEHVSSSIAKSVIGPSGWLQVVQRYVPTPVFLELVKKFASGVQILDEIPEDEISESNRR